MKYFIYLSLLFYSLSIIPKANAEPCPTESDTDHYVITKLRAEKKNTDDKIRVYYKLLNSFEPQKPTLLVINGGPGGGF